jgi:hypothetical protein
MRCRSEKKPWYWSWNLPSLLHRHRRLVGEIDEHVVFPHLRGHLDQPVGARVQVVGELGLVGGDVEKRPPGGSYLQRDGIAAPTDRTGPGLLRRI